MPKMLDMNESGNCGCLVSFALMSPINADAYKDDGDDGKHHDGSALADSLFGLVHRLPSLHNTCLLLFETQQIVDLEKEQ